jgi:EthD domain
MLAVMTLIKSHAELTSEFVAECIGSQKSVDTASVQGRVFNRVIDRTQRGIDYARGATELDAIGQIFCADVTSGSQSSAVDIPGDCIAKSHTIICLQNTVIPVPASRTGLKRMSILRKRPDVTSEDFQNEWFRLHAVLVKRLPGVEGYRQNLVLDGPRDADGHLLVDGIVELWLPDQAAIEANFRSGAGITLMTHAKEFIGEISTFLVHPHEVSGLR